jgi:hypothetical protein
MQINLNNLIHHTLIKLSLYRYACKPLAQTLPNLFQESPDQ